MIPAARHDEEDIDAHVPDPSMKHADQGLIHAHISEVKKSFSHKNVSYHNQVRRSPFIL